MLEAMIANGVGEAVDLEGLDRRHRGLRDDFRRFATEELAPLVPADDEGATFPAEAVQRAAAHGYCGITVPTEHGGLGLDNLALSLFLTETARVCPSTSVTLSVHNSLGASAVNDYGSEATKAAFLGRLAAGELLGAYALTEPASGSDASALETTAVRDGDHFVLNGTKLYVTSGDHAGMVVVFARTDKDAKPSRGISAFAVETSTPGMRVGSKEDKLGLRQSTTVELVLEDCRVPAEHLLGEPGRGFPLALERLDGGRIGIASQGLGMAERALELGVEALKGSPQQDEQRHLFSLAEVATEIDAARLLIYRAARLRDSGTRHTREGAMAKLFATRLANRATRAAIAVAGPEHAGRNSPLGRLFRDARITELYEGTTEIQKLVISRELLRG